MTQDGRASATVGRRSDIQGLRAVAVLVVVAFHAGLPVPGGFVGVDMFFVVSGFVITAMLDREWKRSGRVDFGLFYLRRFKRLTPALALMTAVTMLMSAAFVSPLGPQQTASQTAIGAMLLVANFVIARTTGGYFDAAAETNPLLHTWSLSVEEQFYLFFPALIVLGWAMARRRFLLFSPHVAVAGVGLLSFALAVAGSLRSRMPGSGILLGFYSPLTRAWEFAFGTLLALALTGWTPTKGLRRLLTLLGVIGFGLVVASVLLVSEATPFPGLWTLLPVTGTLLLLLAGTETTTLSSRVLSSPPLVRIGDLSYSIYLWHWPFIVCAGLLWRGSAAALFGAAVVSCVPAVLSYKWVEQPIRNLSSLPSRRWAGLVAATLVPPLVLGSALAFSASHGWWSERVRHLQAATIPRHIGTQNGCDQRKPLAHESAGQCAWGQDSAGKPIYLVGDSKADQLSEGLIRAGSDLNRPVFIASTHSCPFVDLAFRDNRLQADNETCQRYVHGTLEYLNHAEAGLVVISNSHSYWTSSNRFQVGTSSGDFSSERHQKMATFRSGLLRTVESLKGAGHQILLVQAQPSWPRALWDPSRCTPIAIVEARCSAERSLENLNQDQLAARSALDDFAKTPNVAVWDLPALLCPAGKCSTETPTFTRYRDGSHISVPQSIALTSDIREAIASVGRQAG